MLLDGYLSERDAAQELGVTTRTLGRWRKNRTGPAVTYVSRRVMYRAEAVTTWLLSQERQMPRGRGGARATV